MKVIGYTVGTTLPKPNLAQTDPNKGDYIKNRDALDDRYYTEEEIDGKLDAIEAEIDTKIDEVKEYANNIKHSAILETNAGLEQKFWRGTKEEYAEIEVKDEATMYIVSDDYGNTTIYDSAVIAVNGKTGDVWLTASDVGAPTVEEMNEAISEALDGFEGGTGGGTGGGDLNYNDFVVATDDGTLTNILPDMFGGRTPDEYALKSDLENVGGVSDWNQEDETAKDYIKNKPSIATDDEIIEMLAEEDILPVVVDADGSILADENGNILLW